MARKWMLGTFVLLFVTSVLGLLMRYVVFSHSPILPFIHILHAHSHLALLGFGFLFVLGSYLFTSSSRPLNFPGFYKMGVGYIIASVFMAISFIYQSYGPISIAFSTVLMLMAYLMIYKFRRSLANSNKSEFNPFIPWSMNWFVISTIGIWILGPTSAILGKTHDLYFLSIQFFLHFQFNGWFVYVVLGLLYSGGFLHTKWNHSSRQGLNLINIGLVLTYFLSVTYLNKHPIFFLLNAIGSVLQIWGFYLILFPVLRGTIPSRPNIQWARWMIYFGVACLATKVLLQGIAAIPSLTEVAYSIREFIVGFIHLILLGGMTITISGLLTEAGILPQNKLSAIGWWGLMVTIFITEVTLFGHGITTWMGLGNSWMFVRVIFLATIPFPIFIAMIVAGIWRNRVEPHSIRNT